MQPKGHADGQLKDVLALLDQSRERAMESLFEFLRFPSVSAKREHAGDCRACAKWIAAYLGRIGFSARLMETGKGGEDVGHPIVYAENQQVAGRPTVLFYGHYDVQPPEPLNLWTTPAFEPTVRKTEAGTDAVYARGAVDDKGQVHAHLEALAAWAAVGGVNVNVKVLIEGEEEVGSEHLEHFIETHRELLRADIAVISDTGQFDRGLPALTYGLRGLVYEEMFITGPSHDLHSGGFGGMSPNPANVLCRLIASLHDEKGRVNLPGFYDGVAELTAEEKAAWAKLPFDLKKENAAIGIPFDSGEAGYTTVERIWARPTCDVNGLTSGYQGEGAKTVLPSKASVKVSFRLVPNQDPQKVLASFRKAMVERAPKNVKIEFANHGASPASVVPIDTAAAKLALEAMEVGFGQSPTFVRSGGSIPVVGTLKRALGLDTLLVGFGLPDDRVHSPDEKMDLDAYYKGARTAAVLYAKLAELS
jgi:acetylornithine deacetylase/succinyl-diaminopimelate desuccinylase-like protein